MNANTKSPLGARLLPTIMLGVLLLSVATLGAAAKMELIHLSGRVSVRPVGESSWAPAKRGMNLKSGDRIRTGFGSKAVIQMADGQRRTYSANTTVTLRAPEKEASGIVSFFKNLAKPLTSDPARKRSTLAAAIRASATIDGEKMDLEIGGQKSRLSGDGTESPLLGNIVRASAGEAADQVLNFNYLPVVHLPDLKLTAAETNAVEQSVRHYLRGNVPAALDAWPAESPRSDGLLAFQATLETSMDRLEAATRRLSTMSASPAIKSELSRYIAVLLDSAPAPHGKRLASDSASGQLIQSYLYQSQGDLKSALTAARRSAELAPRFGSAWARIAELSLKTGDSATARTAVAEAVSLLPAEPNVRVLSQLVDRTTNPTEKTKGSIKGDRKK